MRSGIILQVTNGVITRELAEQAIALDQISEINDSGNDEERRCNVLDLTRGPQPIDNKPCSPEHCEQFSICQRP